MREVRGAATGRPAKRESQMHGNFYTTEMVTKARIAESLQQAEHNRMLRIAAEGSGQPAKSRRGWPNPAMIRLSRVTLPRLVRLFAG